MKTFSTLLALSGNSPVTTKTSDADLWCFLWSAPEQTVSKVNNRDAGDLRRHCAHYDVIVMNWRVSDNLLLVWSVVSSTNAHNSALRCRFMLGLDYMTWHQYLLSLRWRHNGRDSVSNHQPHNCLLNRLFRCRSKKTLKLRVTCLCAGNSPGAGEFPAQMASNAKNVSIWWRHHVDIR